MNDCPLLDKNVVVSRRSHLDDVRPAYVYREFPDDDLDSGWRAMVGDETDDEIGDPTNLLVEPVGELLHRWPELREVLSTPAPLSDWAWDGFDDVYVPLPD